MKNKKVLITGGAGYIGSRLVEKVIQCGYNVNILDCVEENSEPIKNILSIANTTYFKGSIDDEKILASCTKEVDFVIHLAGVSDGRAGKKDPALTKRINTDSIELLVRISKKAGVKRFLFASTMGVYGNKYSGELFEDFKTAPVDPYSESKAICEQSVKEAGDSDFITTSLRIAMVYGRGPKIKFDFLVNSLCFDAVEKGVLNIVGGHQRRPQIYIDDLCEIFILLLSCDTELIAGEVFNAVESSPSLSEIVFNVKEKLPDTRVVTLAGEGNIDSFSMNGDKLKKVLGFEYQTDLKRGIETLIKYFKKEN